AMPGSFWWDTLESMITSIHTMIYSDDPVATRTFLRDVLGWPFVQHGDTEPAWLIFKSGASEMGVHPTGGVWEGKSFSHPMKHEISLMCDDIHATIADLKSKGAEFKGEVEDHGYGLFIGLVLPGAGVIQLYQPEHPTAYSLD
ncbi:MAG: VOC family protein, partial [Fimbriimonadaceae bacterium]